MQETIKLRTISSRSPFNTRILLLKI